MKEANSQTCPCAGEVAAYLDGELAPSAENSFGLHLTECAECAEKLNVQKRLLCALDFAFDDEKSFKLPANFAKSIAVRAESDVSGLRSKDERLRALLITAGLFSLGALVGMIGKQSGVIAFVIEKLFAQIWVVAAVFGNFCYDFFVGINVVLRMIERQFFVESPFVNLLLTVLLVVAFVILSGLLFKFHRIEDSG
jgi:hypothetical protein